MLCSSLDQQSSVFSDVSFRMFAVFALKTASVCTSKNASTKHLQATCVLAEDIRMHSPLDLNLWDLNSARPSIPFKCLYSSCIYLATTTPQSAVAPSGYELKFATSKLDTKSIKKLSRLIHSSLDALCITSSIHQTLFEPILQFLAIDILANERQLANAFFIWLPVPLWGTRESHVHGLEDKFLLHALHR